MALTVNGRPHDVPLEPERSLLVVLREELGLTGAKYGCGEGACGACTVLLDGAPVRACVTPVGDAAGRSVTTVEGLAEGGRLHPVQQAFLDEGAMQCGYCTPGMVMSAVALLRSNPQPTDDQIVEAMDGNVCRCCAYPRILRAVRATALPRRPSEPTGGQEVAGPATLPRPAAAWDLTEPEDPDWFDVLGPGLVVVVPPEAVDGEHWTTSGGAWIHVAQDGSISAFTGKVDVGQDNRTALAQLVAEELGVPVGSVRVVMGDTDVCPWDGGTFGSRSMPDAGPVLAAAAAGAREHLVRVAAQRLGTDPTELEVAGGRIAVKGMGRSVGLGQLVEGLHHLETIGQPPSTTSPARWRTAGADHPKVNARDAVTGDRRFGTDIDRPGILHGQVLRPPAHGATLREADLSEADAIGGATVVWEDDFVGVAAPDQQVARQALQSVKTRWDRTPQPSDEDLEQHLRAHPIHRKGWGGEHLEERGQVDRALDAADLCLERTYTTAYIRHLPLETRVAVAEWEGERLTVWTGTQRPFGVRETLAGEFGVPQEHVRVIVPPTGAGFGGKHHGEVAVEAARLARAAGRPVKVRWSREEEFTWAYFRPAAVIDVRSGATRDGRLTAWEFTNINSGQAGIELPYDAPNVRIRFQPAESPLPQGSYRGLAATANAFARESHLDELASDLGVDPVRLRQQNVSDQRLGDVLGAAADRAGWESRPVGRDGRGMGVAVGLEKQGRVATVAEVRVGAGGQIRVTRMVTAFDCGAVVSPDNLRNQIEGATIMGLGGALFERVRFEDGRILDTSFRDYRVPRFSDVPDIHVVLIDRRDEPPAGAGETPIIAVAPAIAGAIFAATGLRIRHMPLVPDGRLPSP